MWGEVKEKTNKVSSLAWMYPDRKADQHITDQRFRANIHLFALCLSTPELHTAEGPSLAQWGTHKSILCTTAVSQSVDLGRSNNPNTTPTKDYEKCEWWFTSAVSREDVLRRGGGDLHQQGDAGRDAGYS